MIAAASRRLLEDEPEVVVGRVRVRRDRNPAPAAVATFGPAGCGWSLSSDSRPTSSTVTSDRAPSISNCTGTCSVPSLSPARASRNEIKSSAPSAVFRRRTSVTRTDRLPAAF